MRERREREDEAAMVAAAVVLEIPFLFPLSLLASPSSSSPIQRFHDTHRARRAHGDGVHDCLLSFERKRRGRETRERVRMRRRLFFFFSFFRFRFFPL